MSIRTFLAVLRAACRQAAMDLRAGIVGSSVALLASVSAIVLAGRSTQAGKGGIIACFIAAALIGTASAAVGFFGNMGLF